MQKIQKKIKTKLNKESNLNSAKLLENIEDDADLEQIVAENKEINILKHTLNVHIKVKEETLYNILNVLIKSMRKIDRMGIVHFTHNQNNNILDNNKGLKHKPTSIIDEYIDTNEDIIKDFLDIKNEDDYNELLNFKNPLDRSKCK